MIDDLSTWQSTFAALPNTDSQATGSANMAAWVAARVVSAGLSGITDASPPSFSFATSTFESALNGLSLQTSQSAAATAFAAAWETAINASTLTFASGTYIGAALPATTFSVISSQVIDASSISAAKSALISTLTSASTVDDAADSVLPAAIRTAFLTLTGTLTGLDSTPMPAGPLPLVAANVAFN